MLHQSLNLSPGKVHHGNHPISELRLFTHKYRAEEFPKVADGTLRVVLSNPLAADGNHSFECIMHKADFLDKFFRDDVLGDMKSKLAESPQKKVIYDLSGGMKFSRPPKKGEIEEPGMEIFNEGEPCKDQVEEIPTIMIQNLYITLPGSGITREFSNPTSNKLHSVIHEFMKIFYGGAAQIKGEKEHLYFLYMIHLFGLNDEIFEDQFQKFIGRIAKEQYETLYEGFNFAHLRKEWMEEKNYPAEKIKSWWNNYTNTFFTSYLANQNMVTQATNEGGKAADYFGLSSMTQKTYEEFINQLITQMKGKKMKPESSKSILKNLERFCKQQSGNDEKKAKQLTKFWSDIQKKHKITLPTIENLDPENVPEIIYHLILATFEQTKTTYKNSEKAKAMKYEMDYCY